MPGQRIFISHHDSSMLLNALSSSDETKRRRRLRARILRRNRIKKEIAQGLEPKLHRIPKPPRDDYHDVVVDFQPAFGGNSDAWNRESSGGHRNGMLRSRIAKSHVPQQPQVKQRNAGQMKAAQRDPVLAPESPSAAESSPAQAVPLPYQVVQKTLILQSPRKPANLLARARWHRAYDQIVFDIDDKSLRDLPDQQWRQERFGLLLFAKQEYSLSYKHLCRAVELGATSSTCWRRLAQCYFRLWQETGDWDHLWEAKVSYEIALNHLEITCNPFALFEYVHVLEALGVYTKALHVCSALLQTFPRFQQLLEVKYRFVLLQRYHLFTASITSTALVSSNSVEAIEKEALLTKCVSYTNELLLENTFAEVRYLEYHVKQS